MIIYIYIYIYTYIYRGFSTNGGTPTWTVYNGQSQSINEWFKGTPISGHIHIYIYIYIYILYSVINFSSNIHHKNNHRTMMAPCETIPVFHPKKLHPDGLLNPNVADVAGVISVSGDGNCLFRSIAQGAVGNLQGRVTLLGGELPTNRKWGPQPWLFSWDK